MRNTLLRVVAALLTPFRRSLSMENLPSPPPPSLDQITIALAGIAQTLGALNARIAGLEAGAPKPPASPYGPGAVAALPSSAAAVHAATPAGAPATAWVSHPFFGYVDGVLRLSGTVELWKRMVLDAGAVVPSLAAGVNRVVSPSVYEFAQYSLRWRMDASGGSSPTVLVTIHHPLLARAVTFKDVAASFLQDRDAKGALMYAARLMPKDPLTLVPTEFDATGVSDLAESPSTFTAPDGRTVRFGRGSE